MGREFLNRLKNYLDERLKDEAIWDSFKPFEIDVFSPSDWRRWWVRTESRVPVGFVMERSDGTVSVESELLDKAGDYIIECVCRSYRFKFAKARGNKEEEEKIDKAHNEEIDEARKDYLNRRNFEKHLKKSYWRAFLRLLWFDEVARRISEEYGVEVKVEIDDVDYDSGLISEFDGRDMDEERKFEEIKRRVEAVTAAYKLAYQAYGTSKEKRKDFLEFCNATLAKYGIKRKRGL
ncbi:MAG: hypothetical protein FGF50_05655 [Candidatus Brockarchaeota archaeon]|nr:hypothetical protein [Candidatus Brockarchaeota archaeon]